MNLKWYTNAVNWLVHKDLFWEPELKKIQESTDRLEILMTKEVSHRIEDLKRDIQECICNRGLTKAISNVTHSMIWSKDLNNNLMYLINPLCVSENKNTNWRDDLILTWSTEKPTNCNVNSSCTSINKCFIKNICLSSYKLGYTVKKFEFNGNNIVVGINTVNLMNENDSDIVGVVSLANDVTEEVLFLQRLEKYLSDKDDNHSITILEEVSGRLSRYTIKDKE